MKKIVLAVLAISLFCNNYASAQRITSTINEVTVYLQGALVNRNVQATLTPGTTELIIENLSNFIDERSVVLEGGGDVTILSVNYRLNHTKIQEDNAAGKAIRTEMDSAKMKLAYLQNERVVLEEELQMLRENYKITSKGTFIEDLEDAADFIRTRAVQVRNKIVQMATQEQALNTKVTNLQKQLAENGNDNKMPSGELVVKLSASSYTKANFTLKYFVTNAGWIPTYTLRADDMNQPMALSYDAIVKQLTGEQWKNVKLTLTTGTPSNGNLRPEFNTWYVNIYQPAPQYENISNVESQSRRYYKRTDNIGYKDEESNAPGTDKSIDYASNFTNLVQTSTNVNFEINLRYDVPSDGVGRFVRVQEISLPATFAYTAFPRQAKEAFLTANITGWEDFGLLPGEAGLFLGNTYVGKAFMDPNAASDTLSLFFGADKQIVVERNKVKTSSKKQFIGSNKTETFSYVITVKNVKRTNVTIDIIDQIPVSQNKDITVDLKESSKAQGWRA
ncbi:MAG: mucoidy inhibitor MuiA family protein, partial [Sphingobacteriales bacterium]